MASPFAVVTYPVFMQLLFPTFLIHLTRGLTVACLPLFILEGMELSKFHVGIAIGAAGLGKVLLDLPAGVLLERVGSRKLMMLGALLIVGSSLINLIMVNLLNFPGLVVGMFVYGAGQGAGVLSRLAMMSEKIEPHERGRVSSLLGGSDRLGLAVGPLLAVGASALGGISAVFLIQAILAVASAAVIFYTGKSGRIEIESSSPSGTSFCSRGCASRINLKSLLNVSAFVTALQLVREGRRLVIPIAGYEIGLSSDQVAWYSTISFGVDAALFVISGTLMDTYGRLFSGSLSISLLCLSLLILVPGLSSGIIFLHAILAGLGNGLSAGIVPALGADLAPEIHRAEFLGYFRLFADTGELIGPFLVGIMAQFTSIPTMMNSLAFVGTFGAFWLILFVPETLVPTEKTGVTLVPIGRQNSQPIDAVL